MYFMDLKLIAPLKKLNLIVETYPVWCKIMKKKMLCTFHFLNCVTKIIPFLRESEPKLYKPVLNYFLTERTQTGAF